MNEDFKKFILILILMIGAVAIQGAGFFNFFGVSPNLPLVFLLIIIFFINNFFLYLVLAFFTATQVQIASGLGLEGMTLLALATILFFLKTRMFRFGALTMGLMLALVTIIFYLVVDFNFLYQNLILVLIESLYNIVLGIGVFGGVYFIYGKKEGITI